MNGCGRWLDISSVRFWRGLSSDAMIEVWSEVSHLKRNFRSFTNWHRMQCEWSCEGSRSQQNREEQNLADVFLDKFRADNADEASVGAIRNCACTECLACSGRPVQQDA